MLAGPFCTRCSPTRRASDQVERAGAGDPRAASVRSDARSPHFAFVNRGKESIALDLKGSDEDRALALRIAERADVLVENFRGAMDRPGLGWEALGAQSAPRLHVGVGLRAHRSVEPARRTTP